MFFFIAGVQPKTTVLDTPPRSCPSCGAGPAREKRVDHYVSLFFIPLFRVKKGEPFLECPSCGRISHFEDGPSLVPDERRCPRCGGSLEPRFRFCPFCGKEVD